MRDWIQRTTQNTSCAAGENLFAGLPGWLGELLTARGITSREEAALFLHPDTAQLSDPMEQPGIPEACKALREAKKQGKTKACVYGDYDVDGVCASVIMRSALEAYGFQTEIYIPDRHREGYGLNAEAVAELCGKFDVILTVDCGITSTAEAQLAKDRGVLMIITDHHTPPDTLPCADAIVNPKLPGAAFADLCGAGVALKTAWALCGKEWAMGMLDLCAIATVADMVPLRGENRVIAAEGTKMLPTSRSEGIRALLRVSGTEPKNGRISAGDIAFRLAPRLNAAGRMENAVLALKLLSAKDAQTAQKAAQKLEEINAARRNAEEDVIRRAEEQVRGMDLTKLRCIVVQGEGWDSGVVGLAAGKLAEKYAYPTVCLSENGEYATGSARSACDIDLYAALKTCEDLFLRFGGHRQAAGLTMRAKDTDVFRERLSLAVENQLAGRDLRPAAYYDLEMELSELTPEMIEQMEMLEPFGMENPEPRFLFSDCEMVTCRAVGKNAAHLKCGFSKNGQVRDGIWFSHGEWESFPCGKVDVIAVPSLNVFGGRIKAECMVSDLRIRPDTLAVDPERETDALLQDMKHAVSKRYAGKAVGERFALPPESWLKEKRGTLLFCRKRETALRCRRETLLPLELEGASDPRAYSCVSLYASACRVSPNYSRIWLCDGGAFDSEEAVFRERCRNAEIGSGSGRGSEEFLAAIRPGTNPDEALQIMRQLYRILRAGETSDRGLIAQTLSLSEVQLETALCVLEEMGVLRFEGENRIPRLTEKKKADVDFAHTVWRKQLYPDFGTG